MQVVLCEASGVHKQSNGAHHTVITNLSLRQRKNVYREHLTVTVANVYVPAALQLFFYIIGNVCLLAFRKYSDFQDRSWSLR